jgi:integrase
VLDSRLRFREQLLKRHPHLSGKLDYVFVQDGQKSLGKPFYRTSVTNKTWKRAVRLAGLPSWVRFHSLRHTFASWHVMAGTTQTELMEVGGWKTASAVGRYMHQNEMHKKKVASRLDGVLL